MLATNGGWRTTALVAKGLAEELWSGNGILKTNGSGIQSMTNGD